MSPLQNTAHARDSELRNVISLYYYASLKRQYNIYALTTTVMGLSRTHYWLRKSKRETSETNGDYINLFKEFEPRAAPYGMAKQ